MICLPVQFQSVNLLMNCLFVQLSPGKLSINFLCSLPWFLRPYMLCLSLVSQFPLGPSLCHGSLLRRGSLLLCRGGLLLHYGGLLPCSGGLLLRLLWSGGLLPCSGGLPLCLLWPGGLLPRLLCRGGLLSRQLHPGGLLLCLLRPGGLPLHRGDLRVHLHCYGGFLLHPFCRLHHGPLFCRSCLSPKVLHLYMDLARCPSPCSASAPPPSWIV